MMMYEVEQIFDAQNILGEGPVWNDEENALYWVDIEGKSINRLLFPERIHEKFDMEISVCAYAFREKGGLVLATTEGFAFWDADSKELTPIANPEEGKEGARFNDGKVDRKGRFWAGTMTAEGATSSLYRLDVDGTIKKMETGITISNGIGWSPDDKTMYFVDTLRYVINSYDFDLEKGEISNKRDFVKFSEDGGVPDGMTVDSEGYVWCAMCMGGRVVRYSPEGKLDMDIKMPVDLPTSVMFGGDNLDELFITSGWITLDEEKRKKQPYAGDIFRIRTQAKGLPETKFGG
jgi:sugar lactone lactonase YvrE